MKNMKKTHKQSYRVRFVACLAAVILCLTGCGKQAEPAPELLEPVSVNAAYRPVAYGDVGKKVIKTGSIVPTDYCHFFQSAGSISEIYVTVGQYVTAGTVLAEIDGGDLRDSIESMKESLQQQKAVQEINQEIYKENQKKYDYKIRACEEFGDPEGAEALRLEKATAEENNRYDIMLFDHQIKKTETQIAEKEALRGDTTLVARHSGYVTYVRDITHDTNIGSGENIVIISDTDDPYIEITDEKVKKGAYDVFKIMYTVIDGQRYEIEPYNYTNEELAAAQSASALPYVRFRLKNGDSSLLTAGNIIPLYFSTSDVSNVLVIGSDSLYTEGEDTFVYVKTEENEMEKRDIVIGESDDNYIQVIEGLTEGELVYYASDSIIPSSYAEYTVPLNSINKISDQTSYSMDDVHMVSYYAPCDGYFTQFSISRGDWVSKGDVLFVIDSGGGSAELKQLDIDIGHAREDYNISMEDYKNQIDELDRQIADYKAGKVPDVPQEEEVEIASGGDALTEPEPVNTLYMAEQLTCDKQIMIYNKELLTLNYNNQMKALNEQREQLNKNNDGYGNISVYAENDGYVKTIDADEGHKVTAGDRIATVGSEESVIMAVTLKALQGGTPRLLFGQSVTLVKVTDESQKLTGKCIGMSADANRSYITTTEDGDVFVTHSNVTGDTKYYVAVDDESFYDNPSGYKVQYSTLYLENITTVPPNMVYHEVRKKDGKEFDYVWRVVGDEIVKQYVTLGESDRISQSVLSGLSEGDVLAKETGQ